MSAPDRITRSRIEDFMWPISRENCRDTTIAHLLGRLFYVACAMHPDRDWDWLYPVSGVGLHGRAEPLKHPTVLSSDLYTLGLRLMDKAKAKAERAARITKSAAMDDRDGAADRHTRGGTNAPARLLAATDRGALA